MTVTGVMSGLLRRQEGGRPPFATLRRSLRLNLPDVNNHEPDDVAYTYNGYAPISLRLVGLCPARPFQSSSYEPS